ncbi:MAG: anti-sigma factor antagonist [Firmicutes bacterium]|nr:anti-sigma factor antagonist [Candidatus Fermentithermobacillaceae bacterium]
MHLTFHKTPWFLAARVTGDLDLSTAGEFKEKVDSEIRKTGLLNLILNLKGVGFIDSTGIAAILGRYKNISALGGKMVLIDVPERVSAMLDLAGMGSLIPRFSCLDEALVAMGLGDKIGEKTGEGRPVD